MLFFSVLMNSLWSILHFIQNDKNRRTKGSTFQEKSPYLLIMKPVKHYYAFIILFILSGCAASNDIQLEKVTETSGYLHCDKVFSNSRDSIIQLNQILIQTGTIDTTDERSFKAAIIHIQGKEVILDLVKANQSHSEWREQYAGKGYKLELNYEPKNLGNDTIYTGNCQVWQGKLHSDIKVEGIRNNL
jgi:hypothetical protein